MHELRATPAEPADLHAELERMTEMVRSGGIRASHLFLAKNFQDAMARLRSGAPQTSEEAKEIAAMLRSVEPPMAWPTPAAPAAPRNRAERRAMASKRGRR